jgi:hypothetical protein
MHVRPQPDEYQVALVAPPPRYERPRRDASGRIIQPETPLMARKALEDRDAALDKWIKRFVKTHGLEEVYASTPDERDELLADVRHGTLQVRGLVKRSLPKYRDEETRTRELATEMEGLRTATAGTASAASYGGWDADHADADADADADLLARCERVAASLGASLHEEYEMARAETERDEAVGRVVESREALAARFGEHLDVDLAPILLDPTADAGAKRAALRQLDAISTRASRSAWLTRAMGAARAAAADSTGGEGAQLGARPLAARAASPKPVEPSQRVPAAAQDAQPRVEPHRLPPERRGEPSRPLSYPRMEPPPPPLGTPPAWPREHGT